MKNKAVKTNNKDFRVLLINCNTMLDTLVTAGIGLLSSSLKDADIDVKLFDTTFYKTREKTGDEARAMALQVKETSFEDLGIIPENTDVIDDFVKQVEAYKPHLIGLSCIEVTYQLGIKLLESVRHTGIPTIVGGPYATFAPDIVICQDSVDMVCVGEGEETMVELCNKMRAGEDIALMRNIWIKQGGKLFKNPVRPPILLEKLPYQDWEVYDKRRFWKPMGGKISVTGTFEMNRGCPYNCTFCINSGFKKLYGNQGGYYRETNVDRLIEEMVEKKEKYNLVYVYLVAESFLSTSENRLKRFGKLYSEKVGLPFWVEVRPESVTEDKVSILADMGCEGISVGVESGNFELRKNVLGRNVTNEIMIRAFQMLSHKGLRINANNMIGFPTETREMIFETIELNRVIQANGVMVSFFSPYKGALLRDMCEAEGYIKSDDIAEDYRLAPSMDMPQLSRKELMGLFRTFPLYVKFPKQEWENIRYCEADTPEGNAAFLGYRKRYIEQFMK